MSDETQDSESDHEAATRLAFRLVSALSVALAAAAATVVALAWVGTWEDVGEVSLAHYLFWPLAVAATTLQVTAHRLGTTTSTSGTSA